MIFKGSGVALITPFDKYNNINYEKLESLIEFHLKNNTDAIIICGTTGEASTLSFEEKKKIIKFTVDKVENKIPVIAGTGSNNTKEAIELSKYAQSVNVDGLLIVTPYYNKCSNNGIYLHYETIAKSTSLPIILYNVPSRTNVNLSVDNVIKLSKLDNIVGIKEASSNISQIIELAKRKDDDFDIYSGNDNQILPLLSIGAKGVISVVANIFPKQTHELCYSYFNNNLEKARKMQFKYLDLINCLFIEPNPIPIKEAMNILGYNVGNCRLPLCNLDKKNKEILKKELLYISKEIKK